MTNILRAVITVVGVAMSAGCASLFSGQGGAPAPAASPTLTQACATGWQDDGGNPILPGPQASGDSSFHTTSPDTGIATSKFAWQVTLTNSNSEGVSVSQIVTEFDDSAGHEMATASGTISGQIIGPGQSLSWILTTGDTQGLPNETWPPETGSSCHVVQWSP